MATDRLSPAQARHVLATFRHVEELLERVLRALTEADSNLFTVAHNDFSTAEAETLREAVEAVRSELAAGAETLGLSGSGRPVSARWMAATAARLALIALAELDARHLTAYGEVTEEIAAPVVRVRAHLEEKLERLQGMLNRV